MNELERREIWNGEYRSVQFEIVRWRLGWNYYLFIPKDQIPDELQKSFNLKMHGSRLGSDSPLRYRAEYDNAPIISELDWHGGITLYEKQYNEIGKIAGYRLGCDYMHYFDQHHVYSQKSIELEVRSSIDKLWELVPNLKTRCAWNGKFYPIEETFVTDKGVRVAEENREKWYKPVIYKEASYGNSN